MNLNFFFRRCSWVLAAHQKKILLTKDDISSLNKIIYSLYDTLQNRCNFVQSFSWEVVVVEMSSSAEDDEEKKLYDNPICRMPTHHELLMNFSHLYRTNELVVILSPRKEVMVCITDIFYTHHGQCGSFTPFAMSFRLLWPILSIFYLLIMMQPLVTEYFSCYTIFNGIMQVSYCMQNSLQCYLSMSPSPSLEPETSTCI